MDKGMLFLISCDKAVRVLFFPSRRSNKVVAIVITTNRLSNTATPIATLLPVVMPLLLEAYIC